jgi:hypothetical protein
MATMAFMLILVIVAFSVTIVVFATGQSWRKLDRVNRLFDHWMGLFVLTALCFLPVFLLIWGAHSYVIPLEMATEAFGRYDPDREKWEDNLEDEEEGSIPDKHAEELRKRGLPDEVIRGIQEMLWTGWPIIVGATLLCFLIGIQALAHGNVSILREVEANDTCPPGRADSYVGVRTLDSPREYRADVRFAEEREARFLSSLRRGNRSSSELHQRGDLYERIAVARDDFARDILTAIAVRGPAHVIEHLAGVLHEPGHHEIEGSASGFSEHDDEVYEKGGYVLIWNTRRRYVSLACAVESDAPVTS